MEDFEPYNDKLRSTEIRFQFEAEGLEIVVPDVDLYKTVFSAKRRAKEGLERYLSKDGVDLVNDLEFHRLNEQTLTEFVLSFGNEVQLEDHRSLYDYLRDWVKEHQQNEKPIIRVTSSAGAHTENQGRTTRSESFASNESCDSLPPTPPAPHATRNYGRMIHEEQSSSSSLTLKDSAILPESDIINDSSSGGNWFRFLNRFLRLFYSPENVAAGGLVPQSSAAVEAPVPQFETAVRLDHLGKTSSCFCKVYASELISVLGSHGRYCLGCRRNYGRYSQCERWIQII